MRSIDIPGVGPVRLSWRRDLPDPRDIKYIPPEGKFSVDPEIDLSGYLPPPWDQANEGSCTGHGNAGAYLYAEVRENLPASPTPAQVAAAVNAFMPSRSFIYWTEREEEGTTTQDSGASIRDGIQGLLKTGVCSETLWPYDHSNMYTKPSDAAYNDAAKHKATMAMSVAQTAEAIDGSLGEGFPVVFGFQVASSISNPVTTQTGFISYPGSFDQFVGGHCVLIVGRSLTKQAYRIRNSWGTSWGDHGYGWMPFQYVLNPQLASDFWTIRKTSDVAPNPAPPPNPPAPAPTPTPNQSKLVTITGGFMVAGHELYFGKTDDDRLAFGVIT